MTYSIVTLADYTKPIFDEKTHSYKRPTGERLESVSSIISSYKKTFDSDFYASRIAEKEGKSKQEVLAQWEAKKTLSCERGTAFHNWLEKRIKAKKIPPEIKKHLGSPMAIALETPVMHRTLPFAGTIDCITFDNNGIARIFDWKTNEKIRTEKDHCFNNMLGVLSHLKECEYNSYMIQQQLYADILRSWGIGVASGCIVHCVEEEVEDRMGGVGVELQTTPYPVYISVYDYSATITGERYAERLPKRSDITNVSWAIGRYEK